MIHTGRPLVGWLENIKDGAEKRNALEKEMRKESRKNVSLSTFFHRHSQAINVGTHTHRVVH